MRPREKLTGLQDVLLIYADTEVSVLHETKISRLSSPSEDRQILPTISFDRLPVLAKRYEFDSLKHQFY
jgi:hypothetical protein